MKIIKSKIMTNCYKRSIKVNGHIIEYVDSYNYLGKQKSFITNSNLEEVMRRKTITWKQFWVLKDILVDIGSTYLLLSLY